MGVSRSIRYETTGVQAEVDFAESQYITVGITSENSDVTIDSIEFKLGDNWMTDANITPADGNCYSLTGPVDAIRCNVSSLGTSSYYDLNYVSSDR